MGGWEEGWGKERGLEEKVGGPRLVVTSGAKMHNVSTEGASPGGRRLSRSFHSCLRGADHDDLESGRSLQLDRSKEPDKFMRFEFTIKFIYFW